MANSFSNRCRQPARAELPRSIARSFARMAIVLLMLGAMVIFPAAAEESTYARPLGSLTDHTGKPFPAGTLEGRPYVVFFGFTHCPDICPTTLLQMSNLLKSLGADADRLSILFITVDPERDTPESLRDYLSSFDPRITGLTGTPPQIKSAAAAWKAAYDRIDEGDNNYSIAHSAHVYLMDRSGKRSGTINFQEDEALQLTKLKELLSRP